MSSSIRRQAAETVSAVIGAGRSLSDLLPMQLDNVDESQRNLLRELCSGTLRWYWQLDFYLESLLRKPLKKKEGWLRSLLLVGLYQLAFMRIPPHAAVHETVAAVPAKMSHWRSLCNGVLRNFLRRQKSLQSSLTIVARTAHPAWLLTQLQEDWPDDWQTIVDANNQRPPFCLRTNVAVQSREDYLQQLNRQDIAVAAIRGDNGIELQERVAVSRLPGFDRGTVSVQDGAAQLAAGLLNVQPGQRVLDACAAPGGKYCHLLETVARNCEVIALDNDTERLQRLQDNCRRLGFAGKVLCADAGQPGDWWDGRQFDRILLDAPCSATGVIRRHPDIKLLRKAADLEALTALQSRLLDVLWPLLKPGGCLLYATCSILKQENEQNVADFLNRQDSAKACHLDVEWGQPRSIGRQIFPGQSGMDGFYYALLVKINPD